MTDSGGFKGSPFPPVEGVVQGHVEKLAMAWFTASFTPAELREIPHNIALNTIRLMRDELFHDLKSLSIAPTHYCYDHEMSRARAKSGNEPSRKQAISGLCANMRDTPSNIVLADIMLALSGASLTVTAPLNRPIVCPVAPPGYRPIGVDRPVFRRAAD